MICSVCRQSVKEGAPMVAVSVVREDKLIADGVFTGVIWHTQCAPLTGDDASAMFHAIAEVQEGG